MFEKYFFKKIDYVFFEYVDSNSVVDIYIYLVDIYFLLVNNL